MGSFSQSVIIVKIFFIFSSKTSISFIFWLLSFDLLIVSKHFFSKFFSSTIYFIISFNQLIKEKFSFTFLIKSNFLFNDKSLFLFEINLIEGKSILSILFILLRSVLLSSLYTYKVIITLELVCFNSALLIKTLFTINLLNLVRKRL